MPSLATSTLAALEPEARLRLWNRAYEGYAVPAHFDAGVLHLMGRLGDIDEAESPVLLDGHEPVAFGALGRRGDRAWLGGFGVVASHRRRGVGAEALGRWMDRARSLGATRASLEVLEANAAARALYRAHGFREGRWLEVWSVAAMDHAAVLEPPRDLPIEDALAVIDRLPGPGEPWQRESKSVRNLGSEASAFALGEAAAPTGAAVVRVGPGRAGILRLRAAAGPGHADRVLSLLAAAARRVEGGAVRWINVAEDDPACEVLRRAGGTLEIRQVEMTKAL